MKIRALLLSAALPLTAAPAFADVAPDPKPADKGKGHKKDHDKDHGKEHDKDHAEEAKKPHLPEELRGKVEILASDDKDYARADLTSAVKPAGEGGISEGMVVRLTADIPVWRMWSGPAKKDARGNTNRLGQWWGYETPHGTQQKYRTDYEICQSWNDLTWMAKCTLKKGAVVAVGPGQSVSAKTCGAPSEEYPANKHDWQVWIAKAWSRLGADKELDCPADSTDYEVDASNIAKPKTAATAVAPAPAK